MNSNTTNLINLGKPRKTVQVTLPSDIILEGAVGMPAATFFKKAQDDQLIDTSIPLVACICNGSLRELTYPINKDCELTPITLSHSDGARIYRRSLILMLTTAIEELYPNTKVNVSYAVPDGGFYCKLTTHLPFTVDELQRLESHMNEMVKEDLPITKRSAPLDDVVQLFESRGELDKVRLMAFRNSETLTLYKLKHREDYYYGYMVPSTGYLQNFRLIHTKDGFIMQFPVTHDPNTLGKVTTVHKLIDVFDETDKWLDLLGVEDIGRLNTYIEQHHIQELILIAEALHEQRVAGIANQIAEAHHTNGVRIVLIAGPSSSGKTTFSKRLAIQLLAHGLYPFTLEMDNYFVDRHLTPLDNSGEYDFESLYALNLPLFNQQLNQLLAGQSVQLPTFDFHQGKSLKGRLVQISNNQIIIIEGIHGLNPDLVSEIDPELIFRVYVSALTALNIDSHNRIPTTDLRLIRRIVRDAQHRGYTAQDTLARWQSVRRGEKLNIFPYQENANSIFNSALPYELAALRPLADPLLLQVPFNTAEHIEANRLLSFLKWVRPLSPKQHELIPDTSLIREFIGGSILQNYYPGTTLNT